MHRNSLHQRNNLLSKGQITGIIPCRCYSLYQEYCKMFDKKLDGKRFKGDDELWRSLEFVRQEGLKQEDLFKSC
jgi:hypothetical protein